jgi:hypothetical protein
LCLTHAFTSLPGDQQVKLNTESLAKGVYTIRVSVAGKKSVSAHRLIKN